MTIPFNPDWTVHPGATLAEWIVHHDASVHTIAVAAELDSHVVQGIIDGTTAIDAATARRLETATAIPAQLWENLEHQFRTGLREGRTWTR